MSNKKIAKKKTDNTMVTSTVAKNDDGTVQITFTIPFFLIEKAKKETAAELGKDLEISGFRKGKAPLDKVLAHIPENTLLEKTLSKLLPKYVGDAIEKNKLKPVIYPRFEMVRSNPGEDWQIRAITAEIPEFALGDYKKEIAGVMRAGAIWTPDSTKEKDEKDNKPKSREEKEQEVLKVLINTTDIKVPRILIEEEANSRLAKLLERIEKLGLTLESYLASIRKSAEELRIEYESEARSSIALDLILSRIAEDEKIEVADSELDAAITASAADPKLAEELRTPERKQLLGSVLKRRKVLDKLTSLV